MAIDGEDGLLDYYEEYVLSTISVETTAEVTRTSWGPYFVYKVTLRSKMKDSGARLTSEYVVTDIGASVFDE